MVINSSAVMLRKKHDPGFTRSRDFISRKVLYVYLVFRPVQTYIAPIFVSLNLITLIPANTHANERQNQHSILKCNAQNIIYQQQNAPNKLIPVSTIAKGNDKHTRKKISPAKQYNYKIINHIPHDKKAFTQGLVYYKNNLYESTGLLGQSEIRKLDIKSGAIIKTKKLNERYFGEGISIINNRLTQLTWQLGHALIYDTENLTHIGQHQYSGEGWGITSINNRLLISDGSSKLRWLGSKYNGQDNIQVTEQGTAIQGLNELEYINGLIYANVWPTDCIAQIEPDTGNVVAWINLTGLYPKTLRPHWTAILNGIAHRKDKPYLFVTGKYWPYIFEIEVVSHNTNKQVKSTVISDI